MLLSTVGNSDGNENIIALYYIIMIIKYVDKPNIHVYPHIM